MSDRPQDPSPRWWEGCVGYQVYIRSFQDTDGDGVGDLQGVRQRLPYLADLGVDLVWITPFYPSPQADHGYDVSDYTDVDPTFGTLDDVDALVADAHQVGLRIVLDLVPNHTSSAHPWFRAALAGDERFRDYYVWRDPAPDGGPPNNWVAHFGGPAWTLDESSGQYYMHLFLPEQPDLNWQNPAVRGEFEQILEFWLARDVDGLRIDVAHSLIEDADLRDNPLIGEAPGPDAHPKEVFAAYDHVHDLDRPEVLDIYRTWNRIAESHGAVLIGEVYLDDPRKLTRYVADQDGLHTAFCFPVLHAGWDAREIRSVLTDAVAAGSGHLSWPLSSHDDPRATTRFGGGERGARRQLAYWTLLTTLPGIAWLYQGDELGLANGHIGTSEDPLATRNLGAIGRDGSRTPMLWDTREGFGFSPAEPWLPFGWNHGHRDTVEAQRDDPTSHLSRVRRLHAVRRELVALTDGTGLAWLETDEAVLAHQRGDVVCAMNTADREVAIPLPGGPWEIRFATTGDGSGDDIVLGDETVVVPPDATVLIQRSAA